MFLTENLRFLRQQARYSQQDIGQKLKINTQSVSAWETGKALPKIQFLIELSNLYKVSIDDLLLKDLARVGEIPTPHQINNDKSKTPYVILLEEAIKAHCPDLAKRLNL